MLQDIYASQSLVVLQDDLEDFIHRRDQQQDRAREQFCKVCMTAV
jgi:hypothetical protein